MINVKEAGISVVSLLMKAGVLVAATIIMIRGSQTAYSYGRQIFNQIPADPEGSGRDVTVTIVRGETVSGIADDLLASGLIRDKNLFILQENFSEYHGKEQAATYTLNTSMTPNEMLAIMAADSVPSAGTAGDGSSGSDSELKIEGNQTGTGSAEGEDIGEISSEGDISSESEAASPDIEDGAGDEESIGSEGEVINP